MKRIKVNDDVVVIAGKDKGKRGRVVRILEADDRVVIQGIGMVTRHEKKNPQNPALGGRTEKEAPIHMSNVMPWSEADSKGVRVRSGEDKGKKARVSAASNALISDGGGDN